MDGRTGELKGAVFKPAIAVANIGKIAIIVVRNVKKMIKMK